LSFKVISYFKSVLKPVRINKTVRDNKDAAFNDYDNYIIIVDISRNKNEESGI